MELLQLKYFYALAQAQHVTKTAEKLHIAQPALTQTIRRLEKELDVKLFRSSGRNIVLTECGEYLKERIAPVITTLDAIPVELEELEGKRQRTLKINVLAASKVIADTLIDFKKINDNINFKIVQNSKKEDEDITVFTRELFKEQVSNTEENYIFTEKIFLAVPKPSEYSDLKQIRLRDVSEMEFIGLAGSKALRTICDRFCMYAGFTPNVIFESDSPEAVKNLIGANMGIGFWPQYSWGQPDTSHIALIPIEKPECRRDIVIQLHKKREMNPQAQEYFQYLKEYFEHLEIHQNHL